MVTSVFVADLRGWADQKWMSTATLVFVADPKGWGDQKWILAATSVFVADPRGWATGYETTPGKASSYPRTDVVTEIWISKNIENFEVNPIPHDV